MEERKFIAILDYFEDMPDPRQKGKVLYPLEEIIITSLGAIICGAETYKKWTGQFRHAQAHHAEYAQIPAHSALQSNATMHNSLSQHAIPVRCSLWAGKTREAIIAAMQEAKFSEEVIAHILLHKR